MSATDVFIDLDNAFSASTSQTVVLIATIFVVAKAIDGEVHLDQSAKCCQQTAETGNFERR
ncbi:hypothetical protein [Arthrobacter sp.]|uniref:hypothetical protein n=1 Tax=Arthrobacter sp. TaxID=1667 RepID=UPI0026E0EAFE|nr:hypothetical protein [Arthrobacter sp.]MDO5751829.1 hypothetical protein [Arthrobacter sp.]